MFTQTLPPHTNELIPQIKTIPLLGSFYLSGGTALALQRGHRESEDLDFFTQNTFDPQALQGELSKIGQLSSTELSENTLNTYMLGVKLQFLYYPYKLLEDPIPWEGIKLSSILDIACTKIITISMRGSKKDFIDLYFILQSTTLENLFKLLAEKYQNIGYNTTHLLKSLVYFDDADSQPMPRMHLPADWEKIKTTIIQNVKDFKLDAK